MFFCNKSAYDCVTIGGITERCFRRKVQALFYIIQIRKLVQCYIAYIPYFGECIIQCFDMKRHTYILSLKEVNGTLAGCFYSLNERLVLGFLQGVIYFCIVK